MNPPSYDDLLRQLDESRKESDYYRRIAQIAGRARLQETEELSLLVRAKCEAEQRLEKARDDLEKRVNERTAELSRANADLIAEIAERKRAARKLAESENKYRSLFESSIDALSLTQNGRLLDVNPAWLRLHGYTDKSEVIGRDVMEIIYRYDRRLLDERRRNWPQINDRGYPIRDARRDGSAVDVETHSNSIVLAGQEAILTLVRDVRERKKAEEAMPGGGITTLSTENRLIQETGPRCHESQRYAVFRITDTGHGISQKDIGRIFEPFYTRKVMGRSGTGLGLAVVWGTVEDHNGEIDVQSREGEGTTFTLYFPASREAVAETPSATDVEQYMGSGESVLIVDDVFEQREIASRMLKRLGYRATAVSSGAEAVEYIRRNAADLVVLDMMLEEGFDGLDTYRELLAIRPGQKAIIASGFSETTRVKEAQAQGAVTYVRKPYSIETLARAVRDEMDGLTTPRSRAQPE